VRVGVFQVNGLGDQIIAWPTLRALRSQFTGDMELWLGYGMHGALYLDIQTSALGRVFWADKANHVLDVSRIVSNRPPLDLFISISDWGSPSVVEIGRRLGAKRTVGFQGPFDERLPAVSGNMFDSLFSVARYFNPNLALEQFAEPPRFSAAAENAASRFVEQQRKPGERILFVHPETKADKMWSREGYEFVLSRFLDSRPDVRVFLASVNPFALDLGIHQSRVVWVDAHFELALAIARHADLFLGVDSAFLHASDLLRIPGVGLFGPTSELDWGFRFARPSKCVSTGGAPMSELSAEFVLAALIDVDEEREGKANITAASSHRR
jgi:ADP-heptose:LPS heptosyltransferase